MKRLGAFLLSLIILSSFGLSIFANSDTNYKAELASADFTVNAKSAMLIEANTGTVLFEQNADESASPASVTKIMTLLLVMEALDEERIKLDDKVMISDNAASMGGSQVFLEEGESMSVEELIKCTVIASANDAALALAEHVSGSEQSFVAAMNARAKALGLKNTAFENVTGLDDTTEYHYSSARDIAIMSRELIKYKLITDFASLWQDSIRNGEFTLTNTNRLVRYYDGCNGLKTGSTAKAGYCISAAAKRGEMQLIAVVMGAKTRDERNAVARELLDFGFANFALYSQKEDAIEKVPVKGAKLSEIYVYQRAFSAVIPKSDLKKVELFYEIPEYIKAPVTKDEPLGKIVYKIGEEKIGESEVFIKENLEKITLSDIFLALCRKIFSF